MYRHKMRIFLSVILSLALLGFPNISLAAKKLTLAQRIDQRTFVKMLRTIVGSNSSLTGNQIDFNAATYFGSLLAGLDVGRIHDLASITGNADRSILGDAPGALAPIPGESIPAAARLG